MAASAAIQAAKAGTARVARAAVWNAVFVGLSLAHAVALVTAPSIPLIAIGLWWNANTIAHNFIHRPFFRSRIANLAYSAYLSIVLGIPQRLWRDRHLAHHADRPVALRWSMQLWCEVALVIGTWTTVFLVSPRGFLSVYLPGWAIGIGLCWLQGHYEHARGTTSHYGRIYNFFFFNDGYHVEHHRHPWAHWTTLGSESRTDEARSPWPPVLRWLDACGLEGLERLVLRSPALQRFVLRVHEQAFRRLLADASDLHDATIVGGGLFPRTAIVLSRVAPQAALTVVESRESHIAAASSYLSSVPAEAPVIRYRHETFDPAALCDAGLVVVPLAFEGDRRLVYAQPPARTVLVHDWIWVRRGQSTVISWLLLKRLNLVRRDGPLPSPPR